MRAQTFTRLERLRARPLVAAPVVAVLVLCFGCNTSRYGLSYDQRLGEIRQVHVLPINIQIHSIHAGGTLEAMPDVAEEVRERLLEEIAKVIEGHDRTVSMEHILDEPATELPPVPQSVALARAIEHAIGVHHYKHGTKREFDYTIGDSVREICSDDADALLIVRCVGVFPTAGRVGLAVTAAVVTVLTAIPINVETHFAELTMMLIDAETGDVLWYNGSAKERNVRSQRALRSQARNVARHMLKPRRRS